MTSPPPRRNTAPWWRSDAYIAMALSAVVPGAGQIYAGRRRRGFAIMAVAACFLVVLFMMLQDRTQWLRWSVEPTALRWLLVGNGVLLAFRAFAAVDAFAGFERARRRVTDRRAVWLAAALTAVSAAVVAVPHAVAGYYDVVQYDLITTVFAPTPTTAPPVATDAPTTTTTAGTVTSEPPTTSSQGGSSSTTSAAPTSTTSSTTTTTTIPPRIWDGTERLNVLLLGGDGGKGRTSIRTDTIILASIDPESGHTALFSVPRNMARVPVPESVGIWDCDCFPGIINALWRWADDRKGRFPQYEDPGSGVLKDAIGELMGLDVHYYAMINLAGFVELVDAIGGVDITVPRRLYDPKYTGPNGVTREIDIRPGDYHFDGEEALAYARSRKTSDDYNRMGRQRCVLKAVAAQSDTVTLIRAFPTIAATLKENLFTDIPLERLPDFIELVPKVDADEIVSVRFIPDRFTGERTPDRYPTPDLKEIRSVVRSVLEMQPDEAKSTLDLEDLDKACG